MPAVRPPSEDPEPGLLDEPITTDLAAATTEAAAPRYVSATRRIRIGTRSLREVAARGLLINTGFMVGLSGLSLVRGFVLAALLTAEDYGIWGILAVSLGTVVWLKQVGIGDKYLQQDEEDQELAFQKAFTLEVILTGAFMVLLAALVPLFVVVYGEPRLLAPGLVVIALLPAGVLQAPLWVYARNMDFLRQRLLQSIDPVLGFVVAVLMAVAGAGYWALAAGVLAGAWATAIAALIVSPYRIRWRYDRATTRDYFSFSWPLLVANGSSMVLAQTAVITTNTHLGLAAVGAVALANSFTVFTDRVGHLITGTLYPAICAVRDRAELLEESFVKSNRLALMWAAPFGVALTLFCDDLVTFVLGEKWDLAVVLLQITGVNAALGHIAFNWDAYMRATSNTRPMAVANAAAMVVFVAGGLPLLLLYDLRGLAVGIALQTIAHIAVRIYYLNRLFAGFSYLRQALRAFLPLLPAVAVTLVVRLVESGDRTGLTAVGEFVVFTATVVAATLVLERRLLREAFGYLRRQPLPSP